MQAYDSVTNSSRPRNGWNRPNIQCTYGRNIQKDYGQDPQITLFMPLIEGIDGVEKNEQSLGNYIGVNEDANTMYEKVMKIPDSMIINITIYVQMYIQMMLQKLKRD